MRGSVAEGVERSGSFPVDSPSGRYDRVASTLHWIVAPLVLVMLGLGYYMVEVPRQTPLRGELFNLHKSLGLVVLGLMIVRTLWRLSHRSPPLAGLGAANAAIARAVHFLLYLLLLAQPASGFVASSLGRYGVAFFGFELPSWTGPDPDLREIFLTIHRIVARLIVALILLHLAGTIVHLIQGRTDALRRILPWGRRP